VAGGATAMLEFNTVGALIGPWCPGFDSKCVRC
jgi:hypothetical protein